MGVSLLRRLPIFERCTAIWCKGHLEDPLSALDSSNSEARAESRAALEILDELRNGLLETLLIFRGEVVVVLLEARQLLIGGHSAILSVLMMKLARSYHRRVELSD
jgi:hypothetical protein